MSFSQGLVLYLPFWSHTLEAATMTSLDNYRHSCSVTGTTYGESGRTLDNVDDKIVVPDHSALDITQGTMIAWFKPDTLNTYGEMFSKNISADGHLDPYLMRLSGASIGDNKLFGRFGNSATEEVFYSSGAMASGEWYFCAIAWSSTAKILQLNDETVLAGGLSITPTTNNTDLTLGDGYFGRIAGTLGEAGLWNRAFSTTELATYRTLTTPNSGSGKPRYGIIGQTKWDFFTWA